MRIITLVAALLTTAVAAAPKTSTAPADDGSGPRAALLMYDKLVGPNQTDKALGLYYTTSTRERALANALATVDGALANLHKSATARFGKETADDFVRAVDGTTVAEINAAKIQVTGDTASVSFPGSSRPTTMIRVNGEWKIAVKALAQELQSNPRSFRAGLAKLASGINQVADKIAQGQYTKSDAAKKQLLESYKAAFGTPKAG
ncbi:MAG TPA: hypothetical protein VH475_16750 [Tepidisphaeraceae bacterium]|jgi:hypothetical protein